MKCNFITTSLNFVPENINFVFDLSIYNTSKRLTFVKSISNQIEVSDKDKEMLSEHIFNRIMKSFIGCCDHELITEPLDNTTDFNRIMTSMIYIKSILPHPSIALLLTYIDCCICTLDNVCSSLHRHNYMKDIVNQTITIVPEKLNIITFYLNYICQILHELIMYFLQIVNTQSIVYKTQVLRLTNIQEVCINKCMSLMDTLIILPSIRQNITNTMDAIMYLKY